MVKYLLIFGFIFLIGCSDTQEVKRPLKSSYVPPTINYKGQFRKGYVRKAVSSNPNAIRNQSNDDSYGSIEVSTEGMKKIANMYALYKIAFLNEIKSFDKDFTLTTNMVVRQNYIS